jgi:hypothetical protein
MNIKQIAVVAVVVIAVLVGVYFLFGLGYILEGIAVAAFCWSFPLKTILVWVAKGSASAVIAIEKNKTPAAK